MINKDSTDKELLDHNIGGITLREINGISFIGWVANKIDGAKTYSATTQELVAYVKSPPYGKLPEGEKIKIVRKLLSLDITI